MTNKREHSHLREKNFKLAVGFGVRQNNFL